MGAIISLIKQAWIERLEHWAILGIVFFIPSSPAIPNALGILLILLWLIKGQYRQSWEKVRQEPLFGAMLAYILIYPISLLWSSNIEWGVHITERHMVMLFFPFVFMAAKRDRLDEYITAFILGLTLTEGVSYLVWFGLIHLEGVSASDPTPFYLHTEYNPILAWGLYLVMYRLLFTKSSLLAKLVLLIFASTMTANMFITGGRGGQLVYFIVMLILFIQFFYRRRQFWLGLVSGLVFVSFVAGIAYVGSPLFKQRVDRAIYEIKHLSLESHGSIAYRFQLYFYTIAMTLKERPLTGTGVGGLPEAYMDYVGERALIRLAPSTHNTEGNTHTHPHNQFIYEFGVLGIIGVLVLLSVYLAMGWYVWRDPHGPWSDVRLAFIIYAFLIQMSDSLLLAYPTALLFAVFSSLLFWREDVSSA